MYLSLKYKNQGWVSGTTALIMHWAMRNVIKKREQIRHTWYSAALASWDVPDSTFVYALSTFPSMESVKY